MTAADAVGDASTPNADQENAGLGRFDAWMDRLSERLNPILVKEARQALKSKQFVITFMLLLAFGWGWSVLGVAMQAGAIYYAESGPYMMAGYFMILTVPLLIVVPFAAFRSIAVERDHGTFELLSITSLNSRQIVTGKLAVAALQIAVYFSSTAPFIAFTYLLRGLDLFAILYILGVTLSLSMLFTSGGLLLGALSRSTHWQVAFSIVLIAFVGAATMMWIGIVMDGVLEDQNIFYESGFWAAHALMGAMAATYVALFVVAASACVSFASDNRSTTIRVVLMGQQAVFLGGMALLWMAWGEDEFFVPMLFLPAISWAIAGALMTTETGELSVRVKRTLPQSALGRVFLTWFFPGSGTGYVFAVANMAGLATTAILLMESGRRIGVDPSAIPGIRETPWLYGPVFTAFLAAYLGIGRLVILAVRRRFALGMVGAACIQFGIMVAGAAVPAILQLMLYQVFGSDYTVLQSMNWMWTTIAIVENDFWRGSVTRSGVPEPILVIAVVASAVFLVNLFAAAREMQQLRAATPKRISQDDQQRADEKRADRRQGDKQPGDGESTDSTSPPHPLG